MPRDIEMVDFHELPMHVTDMPTSLSGVEALSWGSRPNAVLGMEDEAAEMGLERNINSRTAFFKGWHGLVILGVPPNEAARFCNLTPSESATNIAGLWGRIKRSVKRGVRKAKRLAKKAARLAKRIAMRVLNNTLVKIAMSMSAVLQKIPSYIIRRGSQAAGVNPKYAMAFRKMNKYIKRYGKRAGGVIRKIKRLLPMVLAVGAKIVAQGAFPPLKPIFAFIRRIPKFIKKLMLRFFPRKVRRYVKIAISGEFGGPHGGDAYPHGGWAYVAGPDEPGTNLMRTGVQVMAALSGV